jgi:GNAT superfamily N-acetyltransferase
MMIPFSIRRARREDCPRLLELVRELAAYEKAPDEVTVSAAEFMEAGFGKDPVWHAFVAEREGAIVAFALYYIRFSTWKGRRMYLEDIIVTRPIRGQGIGSALMDRLLEEAREKRLHGMVWQVLRWNKPAIRFYEKYGASFDTGWANGSLGD